MMHNCSLYLPCWENFPGEVGQGLGTCPQACRCGRCTLWGLPRPPPSGSWLASYHPNGPSYHMLIPMMLAYGPKSYAFQTWNKGGEETSSLGKKGRASHLLTKDLKWLAHGGRIEDSRLDRSASPAHSTSSAVPGSMGHWPWSSHSQSRSPSQWHW